MSTSLLRRTASIAGAFITAFALFVASSDAVGATTIEERHNSGDNFVGVFNDTDGSSVAAAQVDVRIENGDVANVNAAFARAQCVDCATAAFALQAVIALEGAVLVPHNQSDAVNTLCDSCVTYAKAGQVVVVTDVPMHLDNAGKQRVRALEAYLEGLDAQIATMTPVDLITLGEAAEAELVDILDDHLVPRA